MNKEIPSTTQVEKPGIYGVQDMIDLVGSNPLHSLKKGEIQDYGELCDQDCQDCD